MSHITWIFWNARERRLRAFWRLLVQIVILFFIFLVLQLVILAPLERFLLPESEAVIRFWRMTVGVAIFDGGLILSTLIAARFLDRRPLQDLGFHLDRDWWLDLGFGLALGALLMTLIFAVELAAGWVVVVDVFQGDVGLPFPLVIWGPLLAFIFVGVGEEILSRGYQLGNLAEGLNLPPIGPTGALLLAWILSSSVFGLLHFQNPNSSWISTVNLILAGLFLGLGRVLTGELAIPIGLHITWNFFQGNVFGFPVSGARFTQASVLVIQQAGPSLWTGGDFGPEAGLVGIGAILLGCLLTLAWVRHRRGRVALALSVTQYRPWQHSSPQQERIPS